MIYLPRLFFEVERAGFLTKNEGLRILKGTSVPFTASAPVSTSIANANKNLTIASNSDSLFCFAFLLS